MLDFEGIGMAMGFGRTIRRQAEDADAAMHEANAIIERKNKLLLEWVARAEKLEHDLAVERAHSAGLAAQGKAARAAIIQGTGSTLLAKTGRHYASGPQDALHVIYEQGFDARAAELRLGDTGALRAQAR